MSDSVDLWGGGSGIIKKNNNMEENVLKKKLIAITLIAILTFAVFALTACGEVKDPPSVNVEAIVLELGSSADIKPIYNKTATTSDIWSFSTDTSGIVAFDGLTVAGLKLGETIVNGTDDNGLSCTFKIYVVGEDPSVNIDTTVVESGQTVEIVPKYNKYAKVSDEWTFTPAIADLVTFDGVKVKGNKVGETVVTGIDANGLECTFKLFVTGEDPFVNIKTTVIELGETVSVVPEYNKYATVSESWTFVADKSDIVEFDGLKAKGLKTGETLVTGTDANGLKCVFNLYVTGAEPTAYIDNSVVGIGKDFAITPKYNKYATLSKKWTFTPQKAGIVAFEGLTVTGLKLGSTEVMGTDENGLTVYFTINVITNTEIGKSVSLSVGEIVSFADASVLTSSDSDIIACSGASIRGVSVGTATVYVSDGRMTNIKSFTVNVSDVYPLGFTVKNYNGDVIDSLTDNKEPFIVEAQEGTAIKEGTTVLTSGVSGINDYGTHYITVSNSSETHTFNIDLLEADGNGHTYDIIATYATLPTLFAAMNYVTNDNEKFVWFGRSGTLSTNLLEADPHTTLSKYIADTTKLATSVVQEIKAWAFEKLKADPDAHFRLYVDDFRHWIEITTLAEMGLNDDRYDVYYCSDGTYQYYKAYSFKNGPLSVYENAATQREEMLQSARHNVYAEDLNDEYMNNGESTKMDFHDDYMIVGAYEKENIHYWAQYPEYMKSSDVNIQAIFYNAIEKKLPELMFKSMTAEQQKLLMNLALDSYGYTMETFEEAFFSQTNGKQYLIITGSSKDETTTFKYVDEVLKKYSAEDYNIYFKPHPSYMPTGGYLDGFEKTRNIRVLPGKLPMELILFTHPESWVGGFNSSLYMSGVKGHTLFFFADSANDLSEPIKSLCNELYSNAEFIKIT